MTSTVSSKHDSVLHWLLVVHTGTFLSFCRLELSLLLVHSASFGCCEWVKHIPAGHQPMGRSTGCARSHMNSSWEADWQMSCCQKLWKIHRVVTRDLFYDIYNSLGVIFYHYPESNTGYSGKFCAGRSQQNQTISYLWCTLTLTHKLRFLNPLISSSSSFTRFTVACSIGHVELWYIDNYI